MQKILVIDDSKELLEMLGFVLNINGYQVQTATTRSKALTEINNFRPDVILMDVRLNYDDGRELCKEIKSLPLQSVPIIFLLSASPELLHNYEDYSADGTIEKPFDIDTISEKINRFQLVQK